MRIYKLIFLLFISLSFPLCSKDISSITLQTEFAVNFPEPSGICYYPPHNTFFLVGDEGHLGEISPDGELLKIVRLGKVDLEGVSYDPWSGQLAAIAEKRNLLLLIDPERFRINRTIPVPAPEDGSYEGVAVIAPGTVALVNQTREKKDKSGILILENLYDFKDREKEAATERYIPTGIVDQSDIYFDRDSESFYILSDHKNTLYRYSLKGKRLDKHKISGENQEGVCFGPDGKLYITQDSGGMLILDSPEK